MQYSPERAQQLLIEQKVQDVNKSIQGLRDAFISLAKIGIVAGYGGGIFDYENKRYIIRDNSIIIIEL
jgi:hypothetical protein